MNRLGIKRGFRRWSESYILGANHPLARNLQGRFPRLFRFFSLRFDPHHFRGLPLTLFLIGAVINAFILSELAEEVREASRLRDLDRLLAQYFFNLRSEAWANRIYHFTRLGSSPTVLTLLGLLSLFFLVKKRMNAFIAILSALTTSAMTAFAGKLYYKYPRPVDQAWYEEFSWSYPSGHATVAMAYYGMLFYLLVMHSENLKWKGIVAAVGVMFILAMGFSRVYLGVHYLSDVISGYCIGFVWLLFSVTLLGWLDFRNEIRRQN
ncbi:MAG: phosphatase PAP2 family protein [Bacteroidetes bacterium]|nr:phosphatase PAP2 family protein [Bacteroidota bacterium]